MEVRHLNEKHQNDLNVKLFDVRHLKIERQIMNVKPTLMLFQS